MDGSGPATLDEIQGDTFGLTMPGNGGSFDWLILVGVSVLFGFGILYFSLGGFIAIILGFLILIATSRTPLELQLINLRKQLRGSEVQVKKNAGGKKLTSFWNSATIHHSANTERDWIFPPPPHSEWGDNIYGADKSGELINEHPNKIGTPQPSTFTNYGLFSSLAFSVLIFAYLINPDQWSAEIGFPLQYIILGIAILWLAFSIFAWKKAQAMQDTPTSNIRSMAVGNLELVGQVRPWVSKPPEVVVDRDPAKSAQGLHSWHWSYEVYRCRKVTTTDSKGRRTTRTVCNWESVRSDSGGHPFVLHDGSGGVLTLPKSFSRQGLGEHLVRWECAHSFDATNLLFELFTSGDVRRHRWTLWGLQELDPAYVMGTATSRGDDSRAGESDLDETIQNSLLEVIGEDGPGFKSRLEKGTELTALDGIKSQFEYLIIPTIALLVAISLLSL